MLFRLALALGAAAGAAVTAAVALAIIDLYLSGHSLPTLSRPWLDWPAVGFALSRADALFMGITLLTGLIAWLVAGGILRQRPRR